MRDDLGRLAVGAKSDVVLVDLHHPDMMPARDPLRRSLPSKTAACDDETSSAELVRMRHR